MEIFKEIKGFEGLYEISNKGNVRSLRKNIILKPSIKKRGYKGITLQKNGMRYDKNIHRLVAIAFIPNPDNLPCVNHKDENKLNNFVWVNDDGSVDYEKSNLEWCTHKYNSNYGTIKERIGRTNSIILKGRKVSEEVLRKRLKSVVAIDSEGNIAYEFASSKEAGLNGFNQSHVSACCRKCYYREGNNFFKGYRWFWKSEWEQMQQATHDRVACGKLDLQ